jgi:hypothetical protein
VTLDGARVRPLPPGRPSADRGRREERAPLAGGRAPCGHLERELAAIPARVAASAAELARACRTEGRDPAEIRRRLWIFTRPERSPAGSASPSSGHGTLGSAAISDAELAPALAFGKPAECRERDRLAAAALDLEMPVLDLSGLEAYRAREALEALPAGDLR